MVRHLRQCGGAHDPAGLWDGEAQAGPRGLIASKPGSASLPPCLSPLNPVHSMKPKQPIKQSKPPSSHSITHPTLTQLGPTLLSRILSLSLLGPEPASPLTLLSISKEVKPSALSALYGDLVIEDDDAVLIEAEAGPGSVLGAVWGSEEIASAVESVTIVGRAAEEYEVSRLSLVDVARRSRDWSFLRTVVCGYPALPHLLLTSPRPFLLAAR